jgi:hypothetical protein
MISQPVGQAEQKHRENEKELGDARGKKYKDVLMSAWFLGRMNEKRKPCLCKCSSAPSPCMHGLQADTAADEVSSNGQRGPARDPGMCPDFLEHSLSTRFWVSSGFLCACVASCLPALLMNCDPPSSCVLGTYGRQAVPVLRRRPLPADQPGSSACFVPLLAVQFLMCPGMNHYQHEVRILANPSFPQFPSAFNFGVTGTCMIYEDM